MSYLLDVKEILEFAVHIEERGYEFYVEAMKKFNDPRATQLFQYLADEEFKHEKVFRKLLANEGGLRRQEADSEYRDYMKEFVKAHPLAERRTVRDRLSRMAEPEQVLELAMEFEKESIIFFTQLKELVAPGRSRAVEKVIHEEMGHLRKVSQMKRRLAPSPRAGAGAM